MIHKTLGYTMATIYYKTNYGIQSTTIDQWSVNLQPGEDFIWSYSEEKGIFNKHLSKLWGITNFRIFMFDGEINKVTGLLMMDQLEDVVVMNTHRVYNSTRVGSYGRLARGFGISTGISTGKSVTVGDILFMSNGQPVITWRGITDPTGLKRLVTAIKKELYPKDLLSAPKKTTSKAYHDKSICLNCGAKNPTDSSFCCKCGHVMR